jgi:hypothetical protein
MMEGDHGQADDWLTQVSKTIHDMGQSSAPFAAYDWAGRALNATLSGDHARALATLQAAPRFGAVDSDRLGGGEYPRVIPNELARLRLAMGDAAAAAQALPELPKESEPDANSMFAERALHAEVQCRLGATARGLPMLVESIQSIAAHSSSNDPWLARLRAVAGLCAARAGNPAGALAFAKQARSAFVAQPGVSPYFKLPLTQLEGALGLRLPPV